MRLEHPRSELRPVRVGIEPDIVREEGPGDDRVERLEVGVSAAARAEVVAEPGDEGGSGLGERGDDYVGGEDGEFFNGEADRFGGHHGVRVADGDVS